MRAEVAENLLDALAFVLVTPEFLGDNRLAYLRRFSRQLGKIGPAVRSLLLDQKWDTGKETSYIKLWCNWLGLLLFVAAGHVLFIYVIKSPHLLDNFDSAGVFLLSLYFAALVVGTLAELTAILAVRWIMFTIGVAAFFVARAIGILHAG